MNACSVYLATQKKNADVNMMFACRTRICLVSQGAVPLQNKKSKKGVLTKELFQAHIPSASAGRAVAHGVLDLATFGLWEVAGTTIEVLARERHGIYLFQVNYEADGDTIKKMQLFNYNVRPK
ncbi:hypothetical protein BH10PSE19_BH10PSE19_01390 [soil metagenome]